MGRAPHRPVAIVIDDDAAAAEAVALTLRDFGVDVVSGDTAASALAQLTDAAAVNWVITDFELGRGPDGVAGLAPLLAAAPEVRVLVLSGAGRAGAGRAAARAGFDFLPKPVSAEAIAAWLARSG